jgi:hypothetical protein
VTKSGSFSLTVRCAGRRATRCLGTLFVDDAASGAYLTESPFSLVLGDRVLRFTLPSKTLKLLLRKKRLVVRLTIFWQEGGNGRTYPAGKVTLLASHQQLVKTKTRLKTKTKLKTKKTKGKAKAIVARRVP